MEHQRNFVTDGNGCSSAITALYIGIGNVQYNRAEHANSFLVTAGTVPNDYHSTGTKWPRFCGELHVGVVVAKLLSNIKSKFRLPWCAKKVWQPISLQQGSFRGRKQKILRVCIAVCQCQCLVYLAAVGMGQGEKAGANQQRQVHGSAFQGRARGSYASHTGPRIQLLHSQV